MKFITNCNGNNVGLTSPKQPANNQIVNQSFLFNMYNNASYAVNAYGRIGGEYKQLASDYLQSIELPKILIASILCKHYEIELYKEMVYYFFYYQKKKMNMELMMSSVKMLYLIMHPRLLRS